MRDRANPFEKHTDKEIFYQIAMTQCGDGGDTPYYLDPSNAVGVANFTHPIRYKTLGKRKYLEFVEFLGDHYDSNEIVLRSNGSRFLNVWVADDRWELTAKLSERFPNQIRGIMVKIKKSDLVK